MPDDGGWEYGTNLKYMKEISDYWVNNFDWKKEEAKINKFSNFKTNVEDIDIHFILEKGSGSKSNAVTSYARMARIDSRILTHN